VRLGLETAIVDQGVYDNTVQRFREAQLRLPTFGELTEPERIPPDIQARLVDVDPDAPHPLNLFRVHWYNDATRRGRANVPGYLVLPEALTGVPAPVVVLLGHRFPMIAAHKVLAAYGCLVPRIVSGQFDPTRHRAVWPSTGNYCRGGVAISRLMRCHGVAVLPEGMSAERFEWLERWVSDPADIIRTPGSESNVKEIYDACAVLDRDPSNVIFNQFREFGNYLAHAVCTGRAFAHVTEHLRTTAPSLRPRAYVSATGSAGTLGAGDTLKERYGLRVVAVEALECPTLLYNGFGEHNIQGIGDKHVPFIHNVMNTDAATAVSDRATDSLAVLFNSEAGRDYLVERRHVPRPLVAQLPALGLSSLCNLVAAIKTARYFRLGSDDLVLTVATDGAELYRTEERKALGKHFGGRFDSLDAAEVFGRYILGAATDHYLELRVPDRDRIFNLGYYTWVEQQGVTVDEFVARRDASFWTDLLAMVPAWDRMITDLNARTGVV
jgi:cysteine synthase